MPHHLLHLDDLFGLLLRLSEVLSTPHFHGDECPCFVDELLLGECQLFSLGLGLKLDRVVVEFVQRVSVCFDDEILISTCHLHDIVLGVNEDVESAENILLIEHGLDLGFGSRVKLAAVNGSMVVLLFLHLLLFV